MTTIKMSEVKEVMSEKRILEISAELAQELVKDVETDIEVLAVLENLLLLMHGVLKENGAELVNDL